MPIIDNAPEMDPTSPEFATQLAKLQEPKPKGEEPPQAKDEKVEDPKGGKGEKKEESPSSEDTDGDDPVKLKAKLKALKKELGRVRENKRDDEERVKKLETDIEDLKRKSKESSDPSSQTTNAVKNLTEEQLDSALIDWEDELADARAKLATAEDRGDDEKVQKQMSRIHRARTILAAVRKESKERLEQKTVAATKGKEETSAIEKDLSSIHDAFRESFPDIEDEDSALWQAGNKVYNEYPSLMKRLGPIAGLVATAVAIGKNPKLAGKGDVKVRKELLNNIEEAAEKALMVGAKGGKSSGVPTQFENIEAFNAYIEKIKSGG